MYGRALRLPAISAAALPSRAGPFSQPCDRAARVGAKYNYLQCLTNLTRHGHPTCICSVSNGAGAASAPPPPRDPDSSPDAVAEWARATFLSAVTETDEQINLAKVGLLISLEEEAAAQAHRATNDRSAVLPDLLVLRNHLARCISCKHSISCENLSLQALARTNRSWQCIAH